MRPAAVVLAFAIACTAFPTVSRTETPALTTTPPSPAATATSFPMVEGHYNVRFGAIALALATQARIDLVGATEGALRRIEAILPGPAMDISIDVDPALVIPEVGVRRRVQTIAASSEDQSLSVPSDSHRRPSVRYH